jgi:large subunit ribosomal protein L30
MMVETEIRKTEDKKAEVEKTEVKKIETGAGKLFAAIRIRGTVNVNNKLKDTMEMLRLRRVNNCVVVPKDQTFRGMLKKVESYLTWGEIDQDTLEKLVLKRGRLEGDKRLERDKAKNIAQKIIKEGSMKNAGIKPAFRLTPPSKGHRPLLGSGLNETKKSHKDAWKQDTWLR